MNKKELSSKSKSKIIDNDNKIYYLDEFIYYTDKSLLKGINVLTITNYNLPKSDKFFFLDGVFNLKDKTFIASDTKIHIHNTLLMKRKMIQEFMEHHQKVKIILQLLKKEYLPHVKKEMVVLHGP